MRSRGRTWGQWNKTGTMFQLARYRVKQEATDAMRECAEIYEQEIQNLIDEGHPDWAPLAYEWARKKGHDRHYMYRGDFRDMIDVRGVKGSFSGQKIYVGASPYRTHHSGLRMDVLASILENYYNRPLFLPAWERAKPKIEARMRQVGANIFRPR